MDSVLRLYTVFCSIALLAGLGVSPAAFALGNDFQPNCNMRRLALTAEQRNLLREIRIIHRQQENISAWQRRQQENTQHQNIARLLQNDEFNPGLARHYVTEYYRAGIQAAVDNLADQHRFFKSLTPVQQKIWLQECLY